MTDITFRLPGLPDETGQVTWVEASAQYVRGRSLAGYVADIGLPLQDVSHVIIAGEAIRPDETVDVPVRESRLGRLIRRALHRPSPKESVSRFDAYTPSRGSVIVMVPMVGKDPTVRLAIIGAVAIGVGAWAGTPLMGGAFKWGAFFQAAMATYSVGSAIGGLTAPKPKLQSGSDGPSSYVFNGVSNRYAVGVDEPIALGERLVGGDVIGYVRRRSRVIGIRTSAESYNDSAPWEENERLSILLLVAGHPTEGPVGITDPDLAPDSSTNLPDIRIGGQHYSNFPGVSAVWRTGAPGQTVIGGFQITATTHNLNIDLSATETPGLPGAPFTFQTSGTDVEAIEVLLEIPGLSHTDDTKGVRENTTRYKLEYRLVGAPSWIPFDYDPSDLHGPTRRITAAKRTRFLETRRVQDLTPGQYEIRIQWMSANFVDATAGDQWHILLTGVTEEKQIALNYEGCSLIGISGMATEQLNGPFPVISSLWRGYIPAKWNGASFDAPSWGRGTFAPAGRNTIWLALSMMRDKNVGAGNEIPDASILLDWFKEEAEYADGPETVTPVDDAGNSLGPDYDEPRFQFDAYLDQSQNIFDLLDQMFASCRAARINSGNKWGVRIDRPGENVQIFGMGRIKARSMQIQFKGERHEITTYEAKFDDAAAEWDNETHIESIDNRDPDTGDPGDPSQPGEFCTEDDLSDLGLPILKRSLNIGWGITRRSQMSRELRFALRQAWALREFGAFDASTAAMLCDVYDRAGLSHDGPQWNYSGNVRDGCLANLVMLDRSVPFLADTTYGITVHFRAPAQPGEVAAELVGKDLIETREVADIAPPADGSAYYGITVTEPFGRIPQEGDQYVYGDVPLRPVRFVDIDRDADQQHSIGWVEYNESVHDTSGPIIIPRYSDLPNFAAPPGPIPELHAEAITHTHSDGRPITDIHLHWTSPIPEQKYGPYLGARVERSFDSIHWQTIQSVDGLEFQIPNVRTTAHFYFRVIPYSMMHVYNLHPDAAAYDDVEVTVFDEAAPLVPNITAGQADGAFWAKWDTLGEQYIYEVRNQDPIDWNASQLGFLWRGDATRFLLETPVLRTTTFYLRARDEFENYSDISNFATVTDTAPAAPTITTITRFKDGFKIRVTPPAGVTDIIAIHLHASQSSGFTPSAANRVSMPVGPSGGEFLFKTTSIGTWYFKATCEDWLSQRMGDWIYSSEDDDTIVVIAPVDPTITMPGGFVVERIQHKDIEPIEGGGGYKSTTRFKATLAWGHGDMVNPAASLVGFQLIIYNIAVGIETPIETVFIPKEFGNLYEFPDVSGMGVTGGAGAVMAIYVDGLTSDLVTSTGVTIPKDTNPHIRDSDDRHVIAYGTSFKSASLPTGVSILSGTYSLADPAEELKITRSGTGTHYVAWDVGTWANEKIDTKRSGTVKAVIQLKIDTPAQLTGPVNASGFDGSSASLISVELDIVNDGEFHTYLVPWGTLDWAGPSTPALRVSMTSSGLPDGGVWRLGAIGLAFENFDDAMSGQLDSALFARKQFDKDPDGDGLYGISPLRLADANGNYVAVQENGFFYLRDEGGGSLVTETPYKLGRNGKFTGYTHAALIRFDTLGDWGLSIIIPEPTSYNKTRIVIQDVANDYIPAGGVGTNIVRKWIEACNFGTVLGSPCFMLAGAFFYGGTLETYSVTGPWTPTAQAKSSLLLQADSSATDATSDAWYYVQDDGLPNDAGFPLDAYFRCVVWISIAMPESKGPTGAFHYCDLQFTCRIGDATLGSGKMDLGGDFLTHGPYKVRLLANGNAALIPIVNGAHGNAFIGRDMQNIKVDWHDMDWESGGTGTITAEIYKIDLTYIEQVVDIKYLSLADVGFAWLEEFGG